MRDFVHWLVTEEKVDGMFARLVGSADKRRQPHCLTRFNCAVITERQIIHITTLRRRPTDDGIPRHAGVINHRVDGIGPRLGRTRRIGCGGRRAEGEKLGVCRGHR